MFLTWPPTTVWVQRHGKGPSEASHSGTREFFLHLTREKFIATSSWKATITTVRFSFLSSQLEILIVPVLTVVKRVKYCIPANVYTRACRKYVINDEGGNKDDDGPMEN